MRQADGRQARNGRARRWGADGVEEVVDERTCDPCRCFLLHIVRNPLEEAAAAGSSSLEAPLHGLTLNSGIIVETWERSSINRTNAVADFIS